MRGFTIIKLILINLIFTSFVFEINAAKILSIFGFPGPSQYIMASALLKGLAERGHQVTSISTFPQKTPVKNFRDIAVMENAKIFDSLMEQAMGGVQQNKSFFEEWLQYSKLGIQMSTNVLRNPKVQDIMKNEKFDLVIVEAFYTEALFGLGPHFNAPMVGVSTFGTINFVDALVNNLTPMSYIPHISLPYDNRMTFRERLHNVVTNLLNDFLFNMFMLPPQEELYKKYFPNNKLSFYEAQKNFSLVLINQHFTLSYPRPYVSNMIEVGGLHVKQKPDPLPRDLQELMDNATEGAIYFSMGSNLKSKDISPETLNIFMDTFRELKVKVFWKFEAESLPNKPDNVVIRKWYPQPSVLAHPNIKLFISHGGFLSTTETIFHAKPILGIPILGDQPMNIMNAVRGGYALSLNFRQITKESFKSSIIELLTNDRYTKRVQQLSRRYRDQPMTPLETAIYWIEYVLRHEGAPHIRNAGTDLNYFEQNNIDVFALLGGGILVLLVLVVVVVRCLIKLLNADEVGRREKVKRN